MPLIRTITNALKLIIPATALFYISTVLSKEHCPIGTGIIEKCED